MTSHIFLIPALHQLLESYAPWDVRHLDVILGRHIADAVVANALARGLEHFHNHQYDDAVHITLPRIERLIRQIARACQVPTTKHPTTRVGGIRTLGEVLTDLHGDGNRPHLPEPYLTACELTLVDPDCLNLRNNFAHGIADTADASDAALILQLGLALALNLRTSPTVSNGSEPDETAPYDPQVEP